ncbi:glycyl-tRNA synthetase beta chain [Bacillus oleivorans]|uniref:Glycine--tRNA ligase beta subunit n=1 Tax=Bacillus oleivorans TaxID=1448271 RepID=A0A285CLJ9_9BACI|nr:glycine--tRNA ligase subunit beta [Bacillus oleivorans]SNX67883.1 glycyl-tRNA synthetase beta chain [Bacillus oleivorans]
MSNVLIEIGLEEMPAKMVRGAMNQFKEKTENWLKENRIDFAKVVPFSTPRRLAVRIEDVSDSQSDIVEEAKGPAKHIALDNEGTWSKAAIGFSKGQGKSVDDIYFKEVNGVEYCFVKVEQKGLKTAELLPSIQTVITSLTFPKNMKWGSYDFKFVRPIKWILALFGTEVIPFTITDVNTGRLTRGHRFLGEEVEIEQPEEYEQKLLSQYVLVNYDERKEAIRQQLVKLAEAEGWIIPIDEELLEEVTNLVEYPTVLFGQFDPEFLSLPSEVLITSMKEHQRYFPVKDPSGTLLPYFVTVRNGDHRHIEKVAKGNEKVLSARLSDANFFFKEDQKLSIDEWNSKLEKIVYQEQIGTYAEKVKRIVSFSTQLTDKLGLEPEQKEVVLRAAQICKYDLVTHMVYEFPELQGYMGEKYARLKNENEDVAKAIYEHYMPRHSDDSAPRTVAGSIVSITDKIDTIVSCFAIGLIPTGSQDPYGLRRQAWGVVVTLLERNWSFSLKDLVTKAFENVQASGVPIKEKNTVQEVLHFFAQRIKFILQEQGVRYDVVDAVLSEANADVSTLVDRARILNERRENEDFKEIIESLSRVINIAKKAELDQEVDSSLFENEYEKALLEAYTGIKNEWTNLSSEEERFNRLAQLKQTIDPYFDHTMVMSTDEKIKANRLALMKKISDLILQFANVNLLQVKQTL